MSRQPMIETTASAATNDVTGALLLGTGLAFASLILVPALAAQLGVGPSLTGALRMALMKASHRAIGKGHPKARRFHPPPLAATE